MVLILSSTLMHFDVRAYVQMLKNKAVTFYLLQSLQVL